MDSVSVTTTAKKATSTSANSNPFEKQSTFQATEPVQGVTPELPSIKTESSLSSSSWFWIMLFVTLLVAIIINLNRVILGNLAKAWSNANFSNLLQRDKKASDQLQYYFLEAIFYINLACLISLALEKFWHITQSFTQLALFVALVAGVYVIRHINLWFLGSVFNITKETSQYSFTINQFNIINGLMLLVMNYFIAFSPDHLARTFIIVAISLLILQFLYRSIRGLLLSARFLFNDQIHFFLYLCTCEIIPFLVGAVYLSEIS